MRSQRRTWKTRRAWPVVGPMLLLASLASTPGSYAWQDPGDGKNSANKSKSALGQFVTVDSPVDDTVYGKVTGMALSLQARAVREGRPAVLVLEITPGRSSPFHQVQGLADFLVNQVRDVKTVAWVPRTVLGNHAILALACDEIVLRDGVSLGDIGLPPNDVAKQTFVLNLPADLHNRKINTALVAGMLNPEQGLVWAEVEAGVGTVLTEEEFDQREKAGQPNLKNTRIKEAGVPGIFTSEQARAYRILAEHVLPAEAERFDVAAKYGLPREAMREEPLTAREQKATIIRLDEVVDPGTEQFVKRQIQRATAAGADLLIFEVDSPEGGLYESMSLADAIVELSSRKVRTVAFVPRHALGGSALVALACDEVYISPKADLGEIQPGINAAWNPRDADRLKSVLRTKLVDLGLKKRRPPALLLAMTDPTVVAYTARRDETGEISYMTAEELGAVEGWTRGEPLPETDGRQLLKLDGRKAHLLGLAEAPVEDLRDLKRRLGLASLEVPVAQQTWVDTLVFELNKPHVTSMLFLLGLLFAYFEMHFGIGLFGISSGVCFLLFFWSRFLGGTADWLELMLFVLGLGCLALELFVLPGFGIFGVAGILLVLFSLVLASQTFILPASQGDLMRLTGNFGTLAGSIVGVFIAGAVLSRYLPKLPFFEGMILTPPGADEPHEPQLNPAAIDPGEGSPLTRPTSLVGRHGVATTLLRPAGKAKFGEELMDVVSEGVFIPGGRPVEIVSVEGSIIVVRPVG